MLIDVNEIEGLQREIRSQSNFLYTFIEAKMRELFRLVWNHPTWTPQQVFDAFGTDAKDLFIMSAAMQDVLKAINPAYQYLTPPVAYAINADGSVTLKP